MIKKLIVIYIEGSDKFGAKQESKLLLTAESRNYWVKYFNKVNFADGMFKVMPQRFQNEKSLEKYMKLIDKSIGAYYRDYRFDDIEMNIIITGDHDTISNPSTLDKTEKIAKGIKARHPGAKIVLVRRKNFKLESIMGEMVCCKINKKILRDKVGVEFPTIPMLLETFGVSQEQFV